MSMLMRININEQRAQVGLNITRSNLNINSPTPAIQINSQRSQLNINSEQPTFTAHKEAVRREMGILTSGQFASEFANAGRQAALQGTARRANDGDLLARFQVQGRDGVPTLARNASMARLGPREVNIGLMPRSLIQMTWNVNQIDVNFSGHSLTVNASLENQAQISLHPHHAVSAYFAIPPHMDITAVPLYA
ncbi:MAG: DUF6470 family protein [Oscillospiraceae bacterium]|nr:DUF6470 family protein [Oscillospiraceae bacterium]MCL2278248.1 DUF6470 family protein [Oscillospiraceae bacterium]